jgi:hypothetical protein
LLQTDQGLEFENILVRNYLANEHGIEQFSVKSPHKASIVERFNRSLKERLYRIFTRRGTYKWYDVLQDVVHAYNNSYHRSIGCAPSEVNKANEVKIWLRLYGKVKKNKKPPKFKINDRVRISRYKAHFEKGFTENWSSEIFIVHEVNTKYNPTMYQLRSLSGELIEGKFYAQEMQLVPDSGDDELFRIDRVIRTRGVGKHKQALVSFRGYTHEEPTWIPYSQLVPIENA